MREGLEELYECKKKWPEGKLESFLDNLSLFLQSYVKQSLAIIRTEQDTREHLPPPPLGMYPEVEAPPLRSTGIPGGTIKGKEVMPSCNLENLPFICSSNTASRARQPRLPASQLPSKDANVMLLPPFQGSTTVMSLGA